jgi:nitrous oxide reductase accessory protein NosL
MVKTILVSTIVLLTVGLAMAIVQIVSRHSWERRVWSCYAALGSGEPLKSRVPIPATCAATGMLVQDLGSPKAEVLLGFEPPRSMWVSYLFDTAGYDSYLIELRNDGGVTRAHLHHGSD